MFDKIADHLKKMGERVDNVSETFDETRGKDTKDAIDHIHKKIPMMSTGIDLKPMFETPEEAKAASEDMDLILIESFKKNLIKYIEEGI